MAIVEAGASGGTTSGSSRDGGPWSSPIIKRIVGILSPIAAGSRSRRTLDMCSGSFMVGQMAVNFSEESPVTKASAKDNDLIDITPEGSFFKELLSQKALPVEDLTSFSGDYHYPANTQMLDRSWEDASAIIKYELALGRIELEMHRQGLKRLRGPSRLLLRRLYYRLKVEKDMIDLKKCFGHMETLFQKLEGSTAKRFEDLRQGFKELSSKNKQIIDEGLAAIEKAKDQTAIDAAFDDLKAKLSSVEKELATFVNDAEKVSKSGSGSWLEHFTWKKFLKYAGLASSTAGNIASYIRDKKPDPSPTPPWPVPPSPSPMQEEPVVEPPPSVPTTPAFYKSIGRQNKGLLNKDFALTPISTTRMKVPFGPDNKSNVSMVVCTANSKVAGKVSCDGYFEDKLRMTITAGLGDFKPKAKLFYAFPFAGVNGALNASLLRGASFDLKLALTLENHGLVAGGKVLLDPVTKKLKQHEVGVSYGPGALKLLDGDTFKLSLYDGGLSQVVAGGLELTYSRSKEEASVCGAVCVKLGDSTSVKAKVDTTGAVTTAVRHSLSADFFGGACVRARLGEAAQLGFFVRTRLGKDD